MSWGSDKWGSVPWGGGAGPAAPTPPTFPSAVISSVDVLGSKLLRLNFNVSMKIDGILLDPSNYIVTPTGAGAAVTPKRVVAQTGNTANYILLKVTAFTVGEEYTVDITNLRTTKGNTVDVGNSSSDFYGRVTKLDLAQSLQQKMYDTEPGSVFSSILIAITGEDEKIGGTEGGNE